MIEKEKLTQIVKEVQKDSGQFELLYSEIIDKVYFWCYNLVGNEADAKDVAQEAIIRIYRKLPTLKEPEMFTTWMYQLVRNCGLNHIRERGYKKRNLQFLHDDKYSESFENAVQEERRYNLPKESYDLDETRNLIVEFIDNLPVKQKEVIMLYYLEEFKMTEIAETLDYSLGTVKSRLHTGRKNLELQINEYQEKNDIKLYSLSLFPLIGIALKEYQKELCNQQTFVFDKSILNTAQATATATTITSIITSKVFLVIVTIITISIAIIAGTNYFIQETDSRFDELDSSSMTHILLYNNKKDNPYIKDITYYDFPTTSSVEVYIELKKEISSSDIQILLNDKEISFDKNKKDMFVQAQENGVYTIIINGIKARFEIKQIQEHAPEVVGAWNYGNYLVLNVNDVLLQIEYEKSYVIYQGREYTIEKDLIVYGTFKNEIEVIIYDKENHYKTYTIKVD